MSKPEFYGIDIVCGKLKNQILLNRRSIDFT